MNRLFIAAFCSCLAATGSAQTLKGFVYDKENQEPLVGVTVSYVSANGPKTQTVTQADGSYSIILPQGAVNLTFTYLGYQSEHLHFIVTDRKDREHDVHMQQPNTMLDAVVVSAGRFEQKLSNITVSMDVVQKDQIALQAPTDLSATLNTLPGIDINDKQPSIRGGNGWMYGVGSRSLVLIDGMNTLSAGSGVINWNTLPIENIEQVEVMKGASSVLYGSAALNGVINIRSKRPGIDPQTTVRAYVGIYGKPARESYQWSDKGFWTDGKYEVTPLLRNSLLTGIRNPLYEGFDFSHSRRINRFDVSAGVNLFTDEGYRQQGFNKRVRLGGNLTYHHPMESGKALKYGFTTNFLSDRCADFFIWRSPKEAYRPSPFANMGREGNTFNIDPFIRFANIDKQTSHTVRSRFYYRGDNIIQGLSNGRGIASILGAMNPNVDAITDFATQIANKNFSSLMPILLPFMTGNYDKAVGNAEKLLNGMFPNATTSDYCDLIAWMMKTGIPTSKEDIIPWLSGAIEPKRNPTHIDKNYTYYVDYQFNKKWNSGAQITTGATYEHTKSSSHTTGEHESDNIAAFVQYDQRFFDRLSVSAGMRAEYYRVDNYYREAQTKLFGTSIPFRPIFRAGLNYQLSDFTFLRASFGQGYRYPSLTEKYARKDIGGVGVYPNPQVKAEKGINAEIGLKQGYCWGRLKGFVDVAGFYTQYSDMIEFRFGFFNNETLEGINSMKDLFRMVMNKQMLGIGAQFYNVSKARIYGAEISTTGRYDFTDDASLTYNLGYIYIQPEDVDYKSKNAREQTYTDPLQMKEKSNESRYLKYRQKHTAKAVLDFNWKRLNLGANLVWKSKTLAVDYIMVDERQKDKPELMDYARKLLFGNVDGKTLHTYWAKHNKAYCTVDLRAGFKITNEVGVQFSVNNVFNKEYSTRPMAVAAPRTYILQLSLNL